MSDCPHNQWEPVPNGNRPPVFYRCANCAALRPA